MVKLKQKIMGLFKHKNLWIMTHDELVIKQGKQQEWVLIDMVNSLSVSIFAGGAYYYGYQHLSIILFITCIAWILVLLDDKYSLDRIDFVLFMKEHMEI